MGSLFIFYFFCGDVKPKTDGNVNKLSDDIFPPVPEGVSSYGLSPR